MTRPLPDLPAPPNPRPAFIRLFSELAWHLIPPLAYLAVMLRYFPYWQMFWIYFDEGYNLIKALLVLRGYSLYNQIWSDQPPLLTYLLAGLFRVNGPGVYASRLLILLFTCLLIWAVVQFMRLAWGPLAAVAAAILLILVPDFILLSASTLVGQPSLAMACVALLFLALWHRKGSRLWLVLSAAAMSFSLLIKLYTGFLLPVFGLGLLIGAYTRQKEKSWWQILQPALIWSLVLTGLTAGLGWLLGGPASLAQLTQPHLAASQAVAGMEADSLLPITFYLRTAWPLLLLGLLAVYPLLKKRLWLMLYPLAWAVTALLILLNYAPVWSHHALLITVPAAMLAGGALAETLRQGARLLRGLRPTAEGGLLAAGSVLALALLVTLRLPDLQTIARDYRRFQEEDRFPYELTLQKKIDQYALQTNWMVTDMPMFAFRAGISVPPNLAVISGKRFLAGDLSEADILTTVQQTRPEQVLIGRFEFPALEAYLQQDYKLVLARDDTTKLYIRQDLLAEETP
jgi:4-amino-4-deoxy-L-arabinose transferase-like glycosyltransferase